MTYRKDVTDELVEPGSRAPNLAAVQLPSKRRKLLEYK